MQEPNRNPADFELPRWDCPPPEPYAPCPPEQAPFPAGKKEFMFAIAIATAAMLLCNSIIFGGLNLGFALGVDLCIGSTTGYLLCRGHKLTGYTGFLLTVSLLIGGGFARSDDGFVKFVMLCFLFVSFQLGITLLAGQQRFHPAGFLTVKDSFCTAFSHGFCGVPSALTGLKQGLTPKGAAYRKSSAIAKGLLIALPVVLVMIFLLARADAAFEALVDLLPNFRVGQVLVTVFFGGIASMLLYSQAVSLHHQEKSEPCEAPSRAVNAITVNTVLAAVGIVYLAYLVSQLAYFVGGFSGILPENYTMAQYARRGFFEMAILCAINLALVGGCVGLVEKKPCVPMATKVLCLFVSVITVFFVAAAGGKMFLYIGSYGLTRLRVLTQVIMLWLGLTTALVAVWLFVPKFPYMKAVIVVALVLGTGVLWADVDSHVAEYNVNHYLSGDLQGIDLNHLEGLNSSALPHIARLADKAPDPQVRNRAAEILEQQQNLSKNDLRSWNYAEYIARSVVKQRDDAP